MLEITSSHLLAQTVQNSCSAPFNILLPGQYLRYIEFNIVGITKLLACQLNQTHFVFTRRCFFFFFLFTLFIISIKELNQIKWWKISYLAVQWEKYVGVHSWNSWQKTCKIFFSKPIQLQYKFKKLHIQCSKLLL